MFELLFSRRWRTASTCEQLLQQLQSRLKLLISKKHALSRDLRSDIVIFIRFNDFINALRRTEQLVLVKNSVVVYELLLRFTKFIIHHIPYIAKHRKLSNDKINEAVSSLVFASASCGQELRELVSIKELFSQRYGQSFVTSALQLRPGNLVNLQMKENLSIPSDTEGAKTLLDEIAKQYLKASRHKYTHEISKQVDKKEEKKVMDSDLNWFSDKQSPHKVYKFCLKDYEEEIRKEDKLSEDDYIEEAQVGKDQRVLRSRESNEEERRAPSSSLLDEIAMEFSHRLEAFKFEYTPNKQVDKEEEEEKRLMALNSFLDKQSPDGAYKFSLTDFEEEIRKEERSMEDDYIKEAQVGKDQRVFRFKERSEENRRSSSSSSLSSIKELCDMESITYYKTQKRTHQRRRRSSKKEGQEDRQKAVTNQHVHHPDYDQMKNKIKAVKAKEEEELQKLVQPKLPDEDQMVNQIKAVKAKEEEQGRLATRYVHPKLPDYDQLVAYFTDLKKQHCMSC